MKINARALPVLLLPVIILGLWTLKLHVQGTRGVDVELPIEGFDPRDPISGHYVTYRLAMGLHDPCRPEGGPLINRDEARCLCFEDGGNPKPNWAGACTAKPSSCHLYLKGSCDWSGFTAGVERFYIPEADSAWLKVVPPKSRIILTLNRGGGAQVKEVRPEGEDYEIWIQRQETKTKSP
jgi:hypothetical protein